MPRLFAALSIPAQVAQALAAARGGVFGARWIEPSDYHVTLRFVGDVDVHAAREVADALATVRRPPVSVEFQGLELVWRRQAARDRRADPAFVAARRTAGRSRTSAAARRPAAGDAQFRAACHLGAAARRRPSRGRRLSRRARRICAAVVRSPAFRALFGARFGRRRALSGRGGLSAAIARLRAPPRFAHCGAPRSWRIFGGN